jgi:hypothetical protein
MRQWWQRRSLRLRLTVWYALTSTIVLLALGGLMFLVVRGRLLSQLDRQLRGDFEMIESKVVRDQAGNLRWPGSGQDKDEVEWEKEAGIDWRETAIPPAQRPDKPQLCVEHYSLARRSRERRGPGDKGTDLADHFRPAGPEGGRGSAGQHSWLCAPIFKAAFADAANPMTAQNIAKAILEKEILLPGVEGTDRPFLGGRRRTAFIHCRSREWLGRNP